jgi:thymidine phosphorylase
MSAVMPPVRASGARAPNVLTLRRLGIDTYQEWVLYMSVECPLCRSEGWDAQSRIQVNLGSRSIVATLNVVTSDLLAPHEASLSEVAWRELEAAEGHDVTLAHPPPLDSLRHVRAKLYGGRVDEAGFTAIMRDITAGRYAAIEIATFVAACAGGRLTTEETTSLTRAMIAAGEQLTWPGTVADKHSVGGLPGNRTTMLVVPIVAAFGLTMPKTSSRAITSPAGTADAMETIAPVALDLAAMRRVVEKENGCIVWGGAVGLSPADDLIIRVERPLDIDSDAQLVASVLSKKSAAGATHVVLDMPVGPTAKVRTLEAARSLRSLLKTVGEALGLSLRVVESDGSQPVGRGIGPALEARDVLAVLQREPGAPADLHAKAIALAGEVLELAGGLAPGTGAAAASAILDDGRAWRKFVAICEAQGGLRLPPVARLTHDVLATRSGQVVSIDNRRLARVAKLAGAPKAPAAGLVLLAPLGRVVSRGDSLFTLHAETPGELAYAGAYADANPDIIALAEAT